VSASAAGSEVDASRDRAYRRTTSGHYRNRPASTHLPRCVSGPHRAGRSSYRSRRAQQRPRPRPCSRRCRTAAADTPVGDEAFADVPVVGGLWATLPATAAYVGGFCLAAAAAAGVPGLGEPSMVGSAEPSPGTPDVRRQRAVVGTRPGSCTDRFSSMARGRTALTVDARSGDRYLSVTASPDRRIQRLSCREQWSEGPWLWQRGAETVCGPGRRHGQHRRQPAAAP
jgi:hypothetical protein